LEYHRKQFQYDAKFDKVVSGCSFATFPSLSPSAQSKLLEEDGAWGDLMRMYDNLVVGDVQKANAKGVLGGAQCSSRNWQEVMDSCKTDLSKVVVQCLDVKGLISKLQDLTGQPWASSLPVDKDIYAIQDPEKWQNGMHFEMSPSTSIAVGLHSSNTFGDCYADKQYQTLKGRRKRSRRRKRQRQKKAGVDGYTS
jgi:hypothetical protein